MADGNEKRVVLRLDRLDPKTRRLVVSARLIGKRRAEVRAQQERAPLADRFEELNEETLSEIRALRAELARPHAIDDALLAERDGARWLH